MKTTKGSRLTPFEVTANELLVSEKHPEKFCLFRVYSFYSDRDHFTIEGSLRESCKLIPTRYRASFRKNDEAN